MTINGRSAGPFSASWPRCRLCRRDFGSRTRRRSIALRDVVTPNFSKADDLRGKTALWIVRDWGGIKGNNEKRLGAMAVALSAMSDHQIDAVLDWLGKDGISSLSKIAAFIRPEVYAVYDSKTSVALNCALSAKGDSRRFHMPENQVYTPAESKRINQDADGRRLKEASKHIRKDKAGVSWLGYAEYRSLLAAFKTACLCDNVLSAEMTLFSNAAEVARRHLERRAENLNRSGVSAETKAG